MSLVLICIAVLIADWFSTAHSLTQFILYNLLPHSQVSVSCLHEAQSTCHVSKSFHHWQF